ncbi:hypothetical protein N752_29560 [Desulforamulus aquiferis]|nr:hypothetical protein N752_29560 [Desulforamulus aquiferis]
MASAVKKVLVGKDRIEQDNFIALKTHYLFDANFCSPGKGNEKGGVEGLVKYVRQNFFVPYPEVRSFDELNQRLQYWCVKNNNKAELWKLEQKDLRQLPELPFPCHRYVEAKVNTYAMVQVETNRYSVPVKYVGKRVLVRITVDRIEIVLDETLIATHQRLYGRKQEHLCLDHYLDLLLFKPRAVDNNRVLRTSTLPAVYEQYRQGLAIRTSKANKDFIQILMLHRNHPAQLVKEAVEMAMAHKVFSFDGVYNFLIQLISPTHNFLPLQPEKIASLPVVTVNRPDLSRYNKLLQKGGDLS